MKQILDLFPAIAFFAAYFLSDIYTATAILIGSLFAVVIGYYLLERKIHKTHLITAIVAGVLGGLTIYIHDPRFILFKPSAVYAIFAVALLLSHVIGKTVLMQRIPQKMVELPEALWRRVNLAWAVFFIFLAVLNLYVALNFSEATWVKFKTFGFTAIMFVFLIAHSPFISPYMRDPADKTTGEQ